MVTRKIYGLPALQPPARDSDDETDYLSSDGLDPFEVGFSSCIP